MVVNAKKKSNDDMTPPATMNFSFDTMTDLNACNATNTATNNAADSMALADAVGPCDAEDLAATEPFAMIQVEQVVVECVLCRGGKVNDKKEEGVINQPELLSAALSYLLSSIHCSGLLVQCRDCFTMHFIPVAALVTFTSRLVPTILAIVSG
jgi:hypothetical protein